MIAKQYKTIGISVTTIQIHACLEVIPIPFFDVLANTIDSEWENIKITFAGPWEIPWVVRAGERSDYEILFVEKGKGKITVGKREHEVDKGSVICLHSGEGNSFTTHGDCFRILLVTFAINHTSIRNSVDCLDRLIQEEERLLKLSNPEEVQCIFYSMHRELALKLNSHHFYAKLLLGNLAYELKKQCESDVGATFVANKATSEFINRIVIYMKENYMNNISLDHLASLVNLHPRYLCTLFRQATGATVHRFLRGIRLDKAKRLLLYTTLSITEIALQVGFNSSQYFRQIFRQCEGLDPKCFRNRSKNVLMSEYPSQIS